MDSCETGIELSKVVKEKFDALAPWEKASETEVQTALEKSGGDAKVLSQFNSLWLIGQKENTGNPGIESAGLCTLQAQMSGGKLMITVAATEIMSHFQTKSVKSALERLAAIESTDDLPDAWVAPSLAAEYVRTGDIVYVPAGFLTVDKAISDASITLRQARKTSKEAGTSTSTVVFCFELSQVPTPNSRHLVCSVPTALLAGAISTSTQLHRQRASFPSWAKFRQSRSA